ncbi:MAG: hypothetical protein B7Y25_01910 [Alphaproteobacteria bacterium 16-39-46]|nr:MAG: hypothetical protein B7Y25_01910 [Alphaproteobacteria bacterium 16-39-46]OZA43911.1 MAG: hypothetical protein B7X84_01930 [Alphaproteobacteria bacterium 17-39-52]
MGHENFLISVRSFLYLISIFDGPLKFFRQKGENKDIGLSWKYTGRNFETPSLKFSLLLSHGFFQFAV